MSPIPESELAPRVAQQNAAILETLRLADLLIEMAKAGAGYYPDWGSRVAQAVEPLRDVPTFADGTLSHNQMLLESNSEFLAKRDAAVAEVRALREALEESLEYATLGLNERNWNSVGDACAAARAALEDGHEP